MERRPLRHRLVFLGDPLFDQPIEFLHADLRRHCRSDPLNVGGDRCLGVAKVDALQPEHVSLHPSAWYDDPTTQIEGAAAVGALGFIFGFIALVLGAVAVSRVKGLAKNAGGDASAKLCEQACCAQPMCNIWQWAPGGGNANGCWMGDASCGSTPSVRATLAAQPIRHTESRFMFSDRSFHHAAAFPPRSCGWPSMRRNNDNAAGGNSGNDKMTLAHCAPDAISGQHKLQNAPAADTKSSPVLSSSITDISSV